MAKGDRVRRLLAALLVAAAIALAIGLAVSSSQGSSSVELTPVDGQTTGEVVDQLNELIDDNTR